LQLREFLAVVNKAAGEGARLGVVMLDRGWRHKVRPLGTVRIKRMAPFGHAPTIVVPPLDEKGLLPQILAILAHPQVPGLAIDRHSPRVAQAQGPDLRPSPLDTYERIVARNGIGLARL